jgi:hypothetical protein
MYAWYGVILRSGDGFTVRGKCPIVLPAVSRTLNSVAVWVGARLRMNKV